MGDMTTPLGQHTVRSIPSQYTMVREASANTP